MRPLRLALLCLALAVVSAVLVAAARAGGSHGLVHRPPRNHRAPRLPSRSLHARSSPPAQLDFSLLRREGDPHAVALDPELGAAYRRAVHRRFGLDERGLGSRYARRDILASSISLATQNLGASYLAPIAVGTPSIHLQAVLDTGSTDTWLQSTAYDPTKSTSYAPLSSSGAELTPSQSGATVTLAYGGGNVTGTLGHDNIQLSNQIVTSQPLVVAHTASAGVLTGGMHGILGMAFPSLSKVGAQPFWMGAGLNDKTFAFQLARAGSAASQVINGTVQQKSSSSSSSASASDATVMVDSNMTMTGGTFTLGGTNTSLYAQDVNWMPVKEAKFWMVTMGGLHAGGKAIGLNGLTNAAIDTASTLVGGPSEVVRNFYKAIPSAREATAEGYWTLPCPAQSGQGASLPNLSIHLGGRLYTLPPQSWIVPAAAPGLVDGAQQTPASSSCIGILFDLGTNKKSQPQWIIGSDFLSLVYSIFTANDASSPQVGLAPLANSTDNLVNITSAPQSSSAAALALAPGPMWRTLLSALVVAGVLTIHPSASASVSAS